MLSIEVTGQVLDIPKDFTITVDLKNPMFNEIGDYSFPFKLPATPVNKAILGWKSRIENTRSIWEEFSATILWNGLTLFSGQLRSKLCNDLTYEVTLFIERGNFNWEIKNIALNEMDLGHRLFNTEAEGMAFINTCLPLFYPDIELAFPQVRDYTYHDPPEDNVELQDFNHVYPDGYLHKTINGDPATRTILVPMLYLRYILKRICENLGYTLDDQFFSSQRELNNLVVFSSADTNGVVNFGLQFMYNQFFVPNIQVNVFIAELEKLFNCTFFVGSMTRNIRIIGNKNILLNAQVVDFSQNIVSITNDIGDQLTGYTLIMNPDSGDLLYQAQLDAEKPTLDLIKGAFDTKADIPDFPITKLFDIVYIISEDKWYQLAVVSWLVQWVEISPGPSLSDRFFYGPPLNKNKMETQFSNLLQPSFAVECGNAQDDCRTITPRLFFVDRGNWFGYGVKTLGFTTNYNLSLKYTGPCGLFVKYWKEYLMWLLKERKYVRIEKQMSFLELQNFDFSKKYRINEMNYIIDEIQVTLTMNQIKTAMIKAYSVG